MVQLRDSRLTLVPFQLAMFGRDCRSAHSHLCCPVQLTLRPAPELVTAAHTLCIHNRVGRSEGFTGAHCVASCSLRHVLHTHDVRIIRALWSALYAGGDVSSDRVRSVSAGFHAVGSIRAGCGSLPKLDLAEEGERLPSRTYVALGEKEPL